MSVLTAKTKGQSLYYSVDNLFSLVIDHHLPSTKIDMKVFTSTVNTREIPWTYAFLKQSLPSILHSTCYNDEKIPFSVEVTRTELGHLFEHILLEYLCREKLRKGCEEAVFSGRTNWNWEREPFGLFHIIIDMGADDHDIFPQALQKTILLTKQLVLADYRQISTKTFLPPVHPDGQTINLSE